jgi:hypothetical protein
MKMWTCGTVSVLLTACGALAFAPAEPPAAQPEKEPGKSEPAKKEPVKPAPGGGQPTLDELLGIKPAAPEGAKGEQPGGETPKGEQPKTEGGDDPSKADLNRRLTGKELSDAFEQAVALMGDASTRLVTQKDPGLDTQRVQEDALKRLDQLISSLQKQSQQQQQSSSSSSQKNQDSKSSPQQQKKQPSKPSSSETKQGDGMQNHDGPTLQEGKLNPQLESARAAWGSLPARIRDMLMQGTEDRFSARYKQLTQEYYKRLAEENSK